MNPFAALKNLSPFPFTSLHCTALLCGSEFKQRLFHYTALTGWLLGAFANCERRLLDSSYPSVRPSVRPHGTPRLPPNGAGTWVFFKYLRRKFKVHWNLSRITGTLLEDEYTFLKISGTILLRMRNVWDKSCGEKSIHTSPFPPPPENRASYEIMQKILYSPEGNRWQYGACACVLDTQGYTHTHTLRKWRAYCFPTTTMVTQTRRNVTLYVQWLSCYNLDSVYCAVRTEYLNVTPVHFLP
jgi:hypothetical protein